MFTNRFFGCAFPENDLPPCDGAGDLRAALHPRLEQNAAIAEGGACCIESDDCVFLQRHPASCEDVINQFGEFVFSASLP